MAETTECKHGNSTICEECDGFISSYELRVIDNGKEYHLDCYAEITAYQAEQVRQ